MKDKTETLYDRAYAQEGNPIPVADSVEVQLLDGTGTFVESRKFDRTDLTSELIEYVGAYAASMVAEGMPGSIHWKKGDPA
jgi:hypothetical protein